jgi:hypothetical protein
MLPFKLHAVVIALYKEMVPVLSKIPFICINFFVEICFVLKSKPTFELIIIRLY